MKGFYFVALGVVIGLLLPLTYLIKLSNEAKNSPQMNNELYYITVTLLIFMLYYCPLFFGKLFYIIQEFINKI